MKPINLFGAGIQSRSPVITAQRRLNCYYEITPDGEKNNVVIYGTPGLTLQTAFTYNIRAARVVGSNLYVNEGPNVTAVNLAFVKTTLSGSIANNTGKTSMSNNSTQLILVDGIAGYTSTLPTGALTTISSGGFPNGATTVTYVGGWFICESPGTNQMFSSNLNDGTTWNALNFASTFSGSDNITAVDSDHGILIVFAPSYIEFWGASGGTTFPFSYIQGSAQQWGLAAKYSRAKIDNTLIFLAQNLQGQYQVMQLDLRTSYAPMRISNSDIENIISKLSTPSDAVALSYMVDGHSMYQLTFQSAGRSILYDTSTGMWSETQTGVATTGRHIGDLSVTFGANTYVTDYRNPNFYKIDPSNYTDNGTPIKRLLRSMHLGDGNRFSIDELFLDMETGNGIQSGQGSNPQLMLDISKDNGRTFGYQRFIPLGKVGQYASPRVCVRRVANGRDIVLQLSMTDPVKFVLARAAANIRPGDG